MARQLKNANWVLTKPDGSVIDANHAILATLMDIRDELQLLVSEMRFVNQTLRCPDFQSIPRMIKRIRANTAKPRKVA